MKTSLFAVLALALTGAVSGSAEVIYDNTSNDTFVTYFFSGGPYDQIGDSITLGGTARLLSNASIQFYNGTADSGTFTAMLAFWNAGSPVGSQIGSTYTLNNINIGGTSVLTVDFANLNLMVPSSLVFTVAVSNVSAGLDLGLNAFEPPSIGSSDNTRAITGVSNVFSEGVTAAGAGNLYLQLQAVPEPSTVTMSLGAAALLILARRRKITNRN